MPELPDLEVFSKNLTKLLKGKKIASVKVPVSQKLNVTKAELIRSLEKSSIIKVERDGKELFFHFSNEHVLGIRLMLKGKLIIAETDEGIKHTILSFEFTDHTILAVTDHQGLVIPTLDPQPKEAPDALSKEFTAEYLQEKCMKKRSPIKTIIMDQNIVRGIGNAYADEILWAAKISPFSLVNKLSASDFSELVSQAKAVMKDAVKQISKEQPGIIGGEYRDFLAIHNAQKTKSPTGAKIIKTEMKGRPTYYTEEQVLHE